IRSWSRVERRAYSGSTSVFPSRALPRTSAASRICFSPGRNTSTSPRIPRLSRSSSRTAATPPPASVRSSPGSPSGAAAPLSAPAPPATVAIELVHGRDHALGQRELLLGLTFGALRHAERPIAHFHGIAASGDLDDRHLARGARAEEGGKALRVDGRRGDDHAQLRSFGQDAFQDAQQEIDVETALVRLVDDERVIPPQRPVVLELAQQNAVGHELHPTVG